jgi:hypothetical protein
MSQSLKIPALSLLLFISLASAQELPTARRVEKVVHGTEVTAQGSGIVQIVIDTAFDESICSGTLIAPNAVVTAAHCFEGASLSIQVYPNNDEFLGGVTASRVKFFPGADRNPETPLIKNDLALIFLSENLQGPYIPLLRSVRLTKGAQFSVYGYGLTESNSYGKLKKGTMKFSKITPMYLFAKYERLGAGNPCYGDSGGPVIVRSKDKKGHTVSGIVGIVSAGSGTACEKGELNSFTNLQNYAYLRFIKRNVTKVLIK